MVSSKSCLLLCWLTGFRRSFNVKAATGMNGLRTVYKHLLMCDRFVGFNAKPPIGSAAPEKRHPVESMKAAYKFIPE